MASVTPARTVALSALGACRRRGAHAREVLRASAGMGALAPRDRAFAQQLVLGVVGRTGALDALIDARLRRGTKVEPRVRDALRLSCFELCWTRTPAAVAVDQGVGLVRGVRRQAAGLANAVLRKVASADVPRRLRALERVDAALAAPSDGACSADDLALVSGYPTWLMRRILADRGAGLAATTARHAADAPGAYVAANLARMTGERLLAELGAAGAEPRATVVPRAFELGVPSALARTELVESGTAVVADLATQRLVERVAAPPGSRVLEVGQGRGTKSMLLESAAIAAGGHVELVGIDAEAFKVDLAARRMAAAGLGGHVRCRVLDGRTLANDDVAGELAGPFDLVLVDAPCSGSGTMRRHPEIAWGLREDALCGAGGLPALQLSLLRAAACRVARGGVLAYSTCSVLRVEDERVVEGFLATPEGAAFVCEDAKVIEPAPGRSDAHFLARLRRRA